MSEEEKEKERIKKILSYADNFMKNALEFASDLTEALSRPRENRELDANDLKEVDE